MTPATVLVRAAFCALLLSSWNCGGEAGPDGVTDDLSAAKKKCSSNAQCTGGLVCLSGKCQACTATSQCSSGLQCQAGTCQPGQTGGCSDDTACSNGGICSGGQCSPSACNQRHSGVTGIRAQVQIGRYQGIIHGQNGDHEIAYGTLTKVLWVYAPSVEDTTNVQLAMNVASSTDPAGLPHEIPLTPGQTVEVEGEYIPAATANASGNAVIHFTHSTCGYVKIGNTVY